MYAVLVRSAYASAMYSLGVYLLCNTWVACFVGEGVGSNNTDSILAIAQSILIEGEFAVDPVTFVFVLILIYSPAFGVAFCPCDTSPSIVSVETLSGNPPFMGSFFRVGHDMALS